MTYYIALQHMRGEWVVGKMFNGSQPAPPFQNIASRFHLWRPLSLFGLRTEVVLSPTFFVTSLQVWVAEASFFLALFKCLIPQRAASALPYLTLRILTPRWLKMLQNWWKFCSGEAR